MIVVDASLALKLLLIEADSAHARDRWQTWVIAREAIVAPSLFPVEVASGIRKSVHCGRLLEANGDTAFEQMWNLGVEIREPLGLYLEAWFFAKRFNRPTIYDCCYLALASILGCEFWTALPPP